MARTNKYHELYHPYREGLKKERRHSVRSFKVGERQFFRKTCETLVPPRDIWKDYCGKPNRETLNMRTRSNFQEGEEDYE